MAWVYILTCADGSFYVGSTRNLDKRLGQHASGKGSVYTSTRLPIALAWAHETERVDEAWALERQVHGWSRAKKQALIEGRLDDLPALSRNRSGRSLRPLDRLGAGQAQGPETAG
jgi:putative endonuclease